MTIISALFSVKGTAVATDSLLSIKLEKEKYKQIEWELPKLIKLEKFKGTISFWGTAGIPNSRKSDSLKWSLYEWLAEQSKNPSESTIEDYVVRLTERLKIEFKKQGLDEKKNGIGIHITGYEYIDECYIPELFLISNYKNTFYNKIGKIEWSRHTFHTIAGLEPSINHRNREYRKIVYEFLLNGKLIFYNNGDPIFFNQMFYPILNSYQRFKDIGFTKDIENANDLLPLIKRPIEIVSNFQRDFFKNDKRIIGGKIHDLSVGKDGIYHSNSGD